MSRLIYKENDLYNAMVRNLDENGVVYGANGHYSIGAFYDITKINSAIAGDKDYNKKSNFENNKDSEAAKQFMKLKFRKEDLSKDIYKY